MNKDYYKILGVERNASKEDIKKAFHKLAHKYHPDKKDGDEAKFKEIGEAYGVLSDDKRRSEYDAYGRVFSGGAGTGGGDNAAGFDFSGFDFSGFGQGQGFDFDLGDVFSDFFGGGRQRARRGRDISIDLEVSFQESVFGVERRVLLAKVGTCSICSGTGAEPGSELKTCPTCSGNGKIHESRSSILGSFSTTRICETCHGTGKVPEKKCRICAGAGVVRREEEIVIAVPAGISDGEMIRLTGAGEATAGGAPGDLYVKLHVKPDPVFRKEGSNLIMDLNIKLTDALLGATYTVHTFDGDIEVKIPQGVAFGERLRVKSKGVPASGGRRGDLLITAKIVLPQKISKKAKEAITQLKEEGI
jgi:molecular chaperone DnaJ